MAVKPGLAAAALSQNNCTAGGKPVSVTSEASPVSSGFTEYTASPGTPNGSRDVAMILNARHAEVNRE
ncbi:MAG: hypothetical protein M3501_09130, partial [Actinomycetota bacterium]|nr:hypothetical protein [Actinomycetota bacterium]